MKGVRGISYKNKHGRASIPNLVKPACQVVIFAGKRKKSIVNPARKGVMNAFIRTVCFCLAMSLWLHAAELSAATVPSFPGLPGGGNFYQNIPAPGKPSFITDVKLGESDRPNGGFLLSARQTGTNFQFLLGNQTFNILNGSYTLNAYFDEMGNFDSKRSFVRVDGHFSDADTLALAGTEYWYSLDYHDYCPNQSCFLFGARLDSFATYLANPLPGQVGKSLMGFGTTDFMGWAAQFGVRESVWFYNFNIDPSQVLLFGRALAKNQVVASSITTVPLPAMLWPMVVSLLWIGRSRSRKS
jgi:hypothetical protein